MVDAGLRGTPSERRDRGEGRRSQSLVAAQRRQALRFATGFLLAQLTAGAPAFAQPVPGPAANGQAQPEPAVKAASAPDADPDAKATELYNQGISALKTSRWSKARELLLAAFQQKPNPQIAANLGYVEFKLAMYRDAAEHLSYFLREAKQLSEKDRTDHEKKLADARTKIGTVTIKISPDGASIRVGDDSAGVSPLPGPVFVEPGRWLLEVQKEGFETTQRVIDLTAGSDALMDLRLKRLEPPEHPSQPSSSGDQAASVRPGIVESAQPAWRTPVIAGSVGLAIVGVGLGIGFSVGAAVKNSALIQERDYLVVRTEMQQSICPLKEKDPRCTKLTGVLQARDSYRNVAIAGFSVGGVAAASALVAWLWTPSNPAPSARAARSFMFVPSLWGAAVTGSF